MVDGISVLKKELAAAKQRVDALSSAITTLTGGKSAGVSNARRKKISIALKKSWAERRKKEGKKT